MSTRYLLALLSILVFYSCGTKKKMVSDQNNTSKVFVNEGYSVDNLDFNTFNGRAKARVEFGNENQDVTLFIRMNKDKSIWISVTATLVNYEVARLLITPDSIKVMNKMQSEYLAKPFSYVHKYTGEGVNFSMLQDLLLANVNKGLLRTEHLTIASSGEDTQLAGVNGNLSFQYSLNENKRPKVFRLNDLSVKESLEAFYSSYSAITGYNFPQNQTLNLTANYVAIKAILNYNKVDFIESIEMPFSVPAKYKLVN